MTEQSEAFASWAVLELMGHRRLGGFVRSWQIAGAGVLRIDIPGEDGALVSQFYPPASLYCLTPCSEEAARAVAKANQPEPVHRWELPARTPPMAPTYPEDEGIEIDPEEDDEDEPRERDIPW